MNGVPSLPSLEALQDANSTNQQDSRDNRQQESVSQWHADDKDGHYNFKDGENLTPRCNQSMQYIHLFT